MLCVICTVDGIVRLLGPISCLAMINDIMINDIMINDIMINDIMINDVMIDDIMMTEVCRKLQLVATSDRILWYYRIICGTISTASTLGSTTSTKQEVSRLIHSSCIPIYSNYYLGDRETLKDVLRFFWKGDGIDTTGECRSLTLLADLC